MRRSLLLSVLAVLFACGGGEAAAPTTAPSLTTTSAVTSTSVPTVLEPSTTAAPTPTTTAIPNATSTTTPPPTTTSTTAPPGAGGGTYAFPVQPAGAASYSQFHHDYPATDIQAACGTAVVAVTAGVVEEVEREDPWDPAVDDPATRGGLYTSVVGDDGVRYYGSHLATVAPGIEPGVRVDAGQPLGTVGETGNAEGTGCHLHFGLSPPCGPGDWEVRRGVVYPWPYLDSWKAGGDESPAGELDDWRAAHPC